MHLLTFSGGRTWQCRAWCRKPIITLQTSSFDFPELQASRGAIRHHGFIHAAVNAAGLLQNPGNRWRPCLRRWRWYVVYVTRTAAVNPHIRSTLTNALLKVIRKVPIGAVDADGTRRHFRWRGSTLWSQGLKAAVGRRGAHFRARQVLGPGGRDATWPSHVTIVVMSQGTGWRVVVPRWFCYLPSHPSPGILKQR